MTLTLALTLTITRIQYPQFVELMTALTTARLELSQLGVAEGPESGGVDVKAGVEEGGGGSLLGGHGAAHELHRGLGLTLAEEHMQVTAFCVSRAVASLDRLFS